MAVIIAVNAWIYFLWSRIFAQFGKIIDNNASVQNRDIKRLEDVIVRLDRIDPPINRQQRRSKKTP